MRNAGRAKISRFARVSESQMSSVSMVFVTFQNEDLLEASYMPLWMAKSMFPVE